MMRRYIVSNIAVIILANSMSIVRGDVPAHSPEPGAPAIDHDNAIDLLNRWKSTFSGTKTINLRFFTRSGPDANGGFRTEFAEKYIFEWPTRMKETRFKRSATSGNASLMPTEGPLDESWTHWFTQCINDKMQCINIKPDGSYTLFDGPMTFSEAATSWMRVSPWVCAQYLRSVNSADLEIAPQRSGFSVTSRGERWTLVFEIQPDRSIALSRFEKLDRAYKAIETTQFSEYIDWPSLDFKLPRLSTLQRTPIKARVDRASNLDGDLQLHSECELLSATPLIAINDSALDISIPTDLPSHLFHRVGSSASDQSSEAAKTHTSVPSDAIGSGTSSLPTASSSWNRWILWCTGGGMAAIAGYLLVRRRVN